MSGFDPQNRTFGRDNGHPGQGHTDGFRGGYHHQQQQQQQRPQEMYDKNWDDAYYGTQQSSSEQHNRNRNHQAPQRQGKKQTTHDRPPLVIAGNPEKQNRPSQPKQRDEPNDFFVQDDGEMNAHLSERIIANKRPTENRERNKYTAVPRNPLVEKFERAGKSLAEAGGWRAKPEVPSAAELMSSEVELPTNEISNPWRSVDEYLEAHYELLREDSFSPLRDMVGIFRAEPQMDDSHDLCIYENCRVIGVTMTPSLGICVKMNFSTDRARKKIRWEHSKRLCPGTLVALTTDDFKSVVRIATIAARPQDGLDPDLPNGPEIDILFETDELEIDPTKVWIMVESRRGYFEAFKHTLKALQRMERDFPLSRILTLQDTRIRAPHFLQEYPTIDLTPCFNDQADTSKLRDINILKQFPSKRDLTTSMDKSQLEAVERILTKELAIVQGPPGCGKTFVSVKALSVMIRNQTSRDPPIIVACHTNHALDQLLRYIIELEPNVVRLGGRTQDQDKIKNRTLYNVRKASDSFEVQGSTLSKCRKAIKRLDQRASELLASLNESSITPDLLLQYNLISLAQRNSWNSVSEEWVKFSSRYRNRTIDPIPAWLGDYLQPIVRKSDICLEFEEEDTSIEELKDREAEFDDEFDGKLRGRWIELRRDNEPVSTIGIMEEEIQAAIKTADVWLIPTHLRPKMYQRLERRLIAAVEKEMRALSKEYAYWVAELKIARWEKDAHILKRAKIIGMTTTGVGKYRSLVASMQPKICLIEEAAETLEGPLIAACYPSIQQLILVGDHKQLKGQCSVPLLEKEPYNLAISMFERLVKNGVDYTMLTRQRRMRPEIRQILMPIYPELDDDVQVLNMPSVPGMGNANLYFYAHQIPEEQDEMSKKNVHEAQMVVNFCNYLVENGFRQPDITILTFYSGQVREIYRLLRRHPRLHHGDDRMRVATVDSYQGEENEVVILSLCRSNQKGSIGFLSVSNRVCVALSRAKRGFYMFGDAGLLSQVSGLWWDVLQIMNERKPTAISTTLPLTCQRHKRTIYIEHVSDWISLNGGCKAKCGEHLECGHACTLNCHPYDHSDVECIDRCLKILPCGHRCPKQCRESCKCDNCPVKAKYTNFEYETAREMDRLAERLAEVKTTDMMPAMLKPSPSGKMGTGTPVWPAMLKPSPSGKVGTGTPVWPAILKPSPSGKVGTGTPVWPANINSASSKPMFAGKKTPARLPDHVHEYERWDGGLSTPPDSQPSSKGAGPDDLLISFDSEPTVKASSVPGNGYDMNKVLIPTSSRPMRGHWPMTPPAKPL